MTDVTQMLNAIEQGDPHAAKQLLPLVYDELRRLAAQKPAQEKPGQTLEATALMHGAYVRLVGAGATASQGIGGGLYLADGSKGSMSTDTIIMGNHASTSDVDVFGVFSP